MREQVIIQTAKDLIASYKTSRYRELGPAIAAMYLADRVETNNLEIDFDPILLGSILYFVHIGDNAGLEEMLRQRWDVEEKRWVPNVPQHLTRSHRRAILDQSGEDSL